jgi:ADP-ribose pyrophosphatase YjhB (NUDIX family)
MRYANLVYMIDEVGNMAVILHPKHKVWIPCGTRLKPYEMPHLAIYRVVSEELGLSDNEYEIWPRDQSKTYGETEVVPRPYQVQWEHNEQRQGEQGKSVKSHYDFVYVCTTDKVKPLLRPAATSPVSRARWMSLQELRQEISMHKSTNEKVTFENVEKTYEKILKDLGKLPSSC